MKVAALDLGSNTFLLLIAEVVDGQVIKVYADETRVVKLGQEVQKNKCFHPEALKRAESCFQDFQKIIRDHKPVKIQAVATSAARDVKNREEFLALADRYGIPVQIIPGQMEAEITFAGATCDFPNLKNIAVIDVGGGSTEIIGQDQVGTVTGKSVDVGSVRLTEMFFPEQPPAKQQVDQLLAYARQEFNKAKEFFPKHIGQVIAVAGTPTSLACLELQKNYDENLVHKLSLTQQQVQSWIERLWPMTVEAREKITGMPPKRADVLVAGSAILLAAMQSLEIKQVTVSTRGVRFGVALKLASGEFNDH